jgi:endoglucanase
VTRDEQRSSFRIMAKKPVRRPAQKKRPVPRKAARPDSTRQTKAMPAAPPVARRSPPRATASELELLRELSNAVAVSGDEGAVRRLILDAIHNQVDEAHVDALGNVLAVKRGTNAGRNDRVLVAAHMDEVGLMVTGHDPDGALRLQLVGGVDERILSGKPVLVGPKRLPGVIGATPMHLLKPNGRSAAVKISQLRIDIGADSAGAAEKMVKVGERAAFATEFAVLGPSLRGKALDDRLGCATLVELLRGGPYSFDLHAAFTVQEEVGVRGAKVAGYAVEPMCAFILDCTPAHDLPPSDESRENTEYNTRLGHGPAIYIWDRATISDQRLVRFLQATAEAAGVPYQFRQPGSGGTDAGAIHLARSGVPSVSLSVPGRYLHTPAALVRAEDWRNTIRLMRLALEQFTPKVLKR